MASNKRTPESILRAPKSTPVNIAPQRAPSRAERRKGAGGGIKARILGPNKPFQRPRNLEDLQEAIVEAIEEPRRRTS